MRKLVLFLFMSLFGWLGWWLGARIGIMTGYVASVLFGMAGVAAGVLLTRRFLE